jgi:hypothetical protein
VWWFNKVKVAVGYSISPAINVLRQRRQRKREREVRREKRPGLPIPKVRTPDE